MIKIITMEDYEIYEAECKKIKKVNKKLGSKSILANLLNISEYCFSRHQLSG